MSLLRETIIGGFLVALTGCSWNAVEAPPEDRVADRALERRLALVDRDFEKAYGYLSPGYRANHSLRAYRGRFGEAVNWTGAEVRGVECESDELCVAEVLVSYQVSTRGAGDQERRRPFEEQWIRSEGEWWYLPQR